MLRPSDCGWSADGRHALIRSVAVHPSKRSLGRGSELARFALARASEEGATHAWLFSRTGQLDREIAWSRPIGPS